jgi:transposase
VGRELGVRYVLEGSVRKIPSRVRVTGQLIDASTGAHLWADRFDGAMEDIFDLPLADRGYDADWIRELVRQQGAWANIPPKRNRKDPICSPYLYRARNLIERFFNKIKQCRRVATRYDKLAANYLAFVKLASIRIWLRANESTP